MNRQLLSDSGMSLPDYDVLTALSVAGGKSPLSGNQAAVTAQEGAGGDQSVRPQPSRSPIT
jgi:hypothetical protein